MKHISLFFSMFIAVVTFAQSHTYYNTCYNNFELLGFEKKGIINGDFLQIDNSDCGDVIITEDINIDTFSAYNYYIKFANLHNKEGKSYKVRCGQSKAKSVQSTMCGIVFNHTSKSYWMVTVSCNNSNLYNESVDTRTMKIDLICVTNGKTNVVETVSLDKGVHLNDEYNYLCVNVEKNCIKVSAGIKHLEGVISHMMTDNEAALTDGFVTVKVGCVVGEGALMSIERTVLKVSEVDRLPANVLETHWTRGALDRHFAISKDPFEGYWTYLDRDMEDRWLKIGGRYNIALVATEQGYDVIYVDGAQVKKSQWHTGMKKAEMKKSIFTDNFTARWIDATLESIDEDVYVTFESGVILTFKFPVYKSQIRFSKILE